MSKSLAILGHCEIDRQHRAILEASYRVANDRNNLTILSDDLLEKWRTHQIYEQQQGLRNPDFAVQGCPERAIVTGIRRRVRATPSVRYCVIKRGLAKKSKFRNEEHPIGLKKQAAVSPV
jgi:hypothetical protein